jgi:L-fuconolactonase
MIVDGHLHLFAAASGRFPRDTHELYPAQLEAPVEDFLEVMQDHGVERAVLVPLSAHDEYLRLCLNQYPGMFAGVGVHDPDHPDPAGQYRRRVAETGIQGLRLFHLGEPSVADVRDLACFPLLSAMAEVRHKVWFYGAPDQLPLLDRVLAALPELIVVLNHMGFCQTGFERDDEGRPRIRTPLPPPTLPQVIDLARHPNIHVMFSGQYAFSREPYPYRDLQPVADALYEAYGAARLLWASDYPWIIREPGYGALLELVEHQLPQASAEERAAIMGGTAAGLFSF